MDIKNDLSFVVGAIAKFVVFDSHTFDLLVEELIVIATSTSNEPTYDEVDLLILSMVASNLPNIKHLVPISTTLTNQCGIECQY